MTDTNSTRAALYARVASNLQGAGASPIREQFRHLERFCRSKGWAVVTKVADMGSGMDPSRPGFKEMIVATEGGEPPFDVIVVDSMSRICRDAVEFEQHVRMLAKRGVRIVSITQEFDDRSLGETVDRIMALFDEYDSKERGKHVARAMKENAVQGFYNGGSPPFGFEAVTAEVRGQTRKKKLAPRAGETETVRRIFDLFLNGDSSSGPMGVEKITEWLNDHGVMTRRGARWGVRGVHRLLTDPVNKGEYWHNRNAAPEDRVLVTVPNIVSIDVFDLVQRNLTEGNPKKTPPCTVSQRGAHDG